jgi:16S rRNA (guanine527-N7)-methyltransferase
MSHLNELSELRFLNICRRNGLNIGVEQSEKLAMYVRLLLEWNAKLNLISRRDTANIWSAHILHSISILLTLNIPPELRVLDLGTGGGLPGVPLAIVRNDVSFTLLDSIRKKTAAVEDIVHQLALNNVLVVTKRAEDVSRQDTGGGFDIIVSRAVAPLVDLVRWSKPLVKRNTASARSTIRGGDDSVYLPYLVALKGGDLSGEIRAAEIVTGTSNILTYDITFGEETADALDGKKIVVVHL